MYGSDAVGRRHQHHHRAAARPRSAPAHWPCGNFGTNEQSVSISDTFGARCRAAFLRPRFLLPASCPTAITATCSSPPPPMPKPALGTSDLTLGLHGPPLRRRPVLRPLPFLGGHQNVVRRLPPAAWQEDTASSFAYRRHSDLFVLIRDRPGRSTPTTTRRQLPWRTCAARKQSQAPTSICYYGVEALHESIVSNNLGIHARSRARGVCGGGFPRAQAVLAVAFRARGDLPQLLRRVQPHRGGRLLDLPAFEAARLRQPRLSRPQLTPISITATPPTWATRTCARSAPGLTKAASTGHPRRASARGLTVFERRERDGIDYYRTQPDAIWQALNIDNLNFTGIEARSVRASPRRLSISAMPSCTAPKTPSPSEKPSTASITRSTPSSPTGSGRSRRACCFARASGCSTALRALRTRSGICTPAVRVAPSIRSCRSPT